MGRNYFAQVIIRMNLGLPGSPVAKTAFPMQGAWVLSLVRELDPHAAAQSSHAAAKAQLN